MALCTTCKFNHGVDGKYFGIPTINCQVLGSHTVERIACKLWEVETIKLVSPKLDLGGLALDSSYFLKLMHDTMKSLYPSGDDLDAVQYATDHWKYTVSPEKKQVLSELVWTLEQVPALMLGAVVNAANSEAQRKLLADGQTYAAYKWYNEPQDLRVHRDFTFVNDKMESSIRLDKVPPKILVGASVLFMGIGSDEVKPPKWLHIKEEIGMFTIIASNGMANYRFKGDYPGSASFEFELVDWDGDPELMRPPSGS